MTRQLLFALTGFLLAACATTSETRQIASKHPKQGGGSGSGPAQVLIIRHGEKPVQGDDLSPAGYARAQALVSVFESNPAFLAYGTPVAIYAMAPDPTADVADQGTMRPIETVAPLVQSLRARDPGLSVVENYTKRQTAQAAQAVLSNPAYAGKMVLMCWEHDAVETLLTTFGVSPLPNAWPDSIFGRVYEVNFNPDGSFKSLQCATELPGDSQDCANYR